METLINVGPMIDKAGVQEFRDAILSILEADCDEATKQVALETLKKGVQLEGGNQNAFSSCIFSSEGISNREPHEFDEKIDEKEEFPQE